MLSGLARTGPTTASRLADLIGLDRTVTTRYATRLEEAGLVARAADADDRRAVAALRAGLEAAFAEALETSEPGEVEVFARVLERLHDALLPD